MRSGIKSYDVSKLGCIRLNFVRATQVSERLCIKVQVQCVMLSLSVICAIRTRSIGLHSFRSENNVFPNLFSLIWILLSSLVCARLGTSGIRVHDLQML